MQTKELKTELLIYDVPDHDRHKDKILDLINEIPNNPYEDVSKTDYNLPPNFERKYYKYFWDNIGNRCIAEHQKYFNVKNIANSATWFQQYGEGSRHFYHTHPRTNLTNVYFLELPDLNFKTSILVNNKEYEYEVKEGQIITFPAYILHSSKTNASERKSVIAFNSELLY